MVGYFVGFSISEKKKQNKRPTVLKKKFIRKHFVTHNMFFCKVYDFCKIRSQIFPTLEISDKWGARKRVRISAIIDI